MSTQQYVLSREPPAQKEDLHVQLLYVTCAQYSAEWNSALHTHACAELFFITGGHGVFQVHQERFPVAVHDLVVINAGVSHAETSQIETPLEYVVLGVEGLEALTGLSGCTLVHLSSGQDSVSGCLRMLVRELQNGQAGYEQVCRNLLEIMLLRLCRREEFSISAPTHPTGSRSTRECELVRRYIDNHFKENLTLDQLAALAHINKYYLAHTFRRQFNTSPINYLITRRIQESHFLLSETDHSLSHIAQILGFSSLSYFSQSFRRLEGISPMEYRKRRRLQSGGAP